MIQTILIALLAVAAGTSLAFGLRGAARRVLSRARERARSLAQDAESKAQIRLQEAELEVEEKKAAAEAQFEAQTRKKRQELQQLGSRSRSATWDARCSCWPRSNRSWTSATPG